MDLFDPLKIRDVVLKNRIVVSPMCQYSSSDGFATDWHLVHLGSRAVGGAALVFTEASAVTPEGRISPWDLGIWKDEHIEQLARIARFFASRALFRACSWRTRAARAARRRPWEGVRGRFTESEGGWTPVAPSPCLMTQIIPVPAALDEAGIREDRECFSEKPRDGLCRRDFR